MTLRRAPRASLREPPSKKPRSFRHSVWADLDGRAQDTAPQRGESARRKRGSQQCWPSGCPGEQRQGSAIRGEPRGESRQTRWGREQSREAGPGHNPPPRASQVRKGCWRQGPVCAGTCGCARYSQVPLVEAEQHTQQREQQERQAHGHHDGLDLPLGCNGHGERRQGSAMLRRRVQTQTDLPAQPGRPARRWCLHQTAPLWLTRSRSTCPVCAEDTLHCDTRLTQGLEVTPVSLRGAWTIEKDEHQAVSRHPCKPIPATPLTQQAAATALTCWREAARRWQGGGQGTRREAARGRRTERCRAIWETKGLEEPREGACLRLRSRKIREDSAQRPDTEAS